MKKRIISALLCAAFLTANLTALPANCGNVEEIPGIQLQTLLLNNDGKEWTTESWGGRNLLVNNRYTVTNLRDYVENGIVELDVRNTEPEEVKFKLGLVSKTHGVRNQIYWTDMPEYNDLVADGEWKHFTLPIKPLVESDTEGIFDPDNFWFVILSGIKGHTFEIKNVKISSTDDERQYPFFKVNQVGYGVNSPKTAYLSYFAKFGDLTEKTWEVVNAKTQETVFSDTLKAPELNEHLSGESVHILHFDDLKTPGTYFLRIIDADLDADARSPYDAESGLVTDTLVSWKFEIGNDIYDDLLTDMSRYYYYQRQGIDLDTKYAGDFARQNLHPNDVTVKRWSDRDNPDAVTYDVSQGWYDAGDYGKYTDSACSAVEDLLLAYELYPNVFRNCDPHIPETDPDNPLYVNAPAILSETKWELDMIRKLEHPDHDGSFYIAANYKDDVIYIEDTLKKTSDYTTPEECDLRSHKATAEAAAVFAHAYLVYREIPTYADFAEECLQTAVRAFDWATNPQNEQHQSIGAANRTYTFTQDELDRDLFWAAGSLYRAVKAAGTSTYTYEKFLIDNCMMESNQFALTNSSVGYSHKGRSFLGYWYYLYQNPTPASEMTGAFSKFISWRKRVLGYNNWSTTFPDWGYWWGSNRHLEIDAMTLMMGSMVTGDGTIPEAVSASMQSAFNYILGVNPVSYCYVSGEGENSVRQIYSGIYTTRARLDPYRCPDGYVTEGSNSNNARDLSKFDGKCYIDSDGEYTTNENTIYGNSSMIFLTAAMISELRSQSYHVTVSGGTLSTGSDTYSYGESVTITADPAPDGKVFKEWTGADRLIFTSGSDKTATATFSMPDHDVSLSAVYEQIKTEVIIKTVDINGIKTSKTVYAETFTSADYSVSAPYLDGYVFNGWNVNGETYPTENAANAAIETLVKAETPVTVKEVYEKKNAYYDISVIGGKLSTGKTNGNIQVSKLVTVKANTVERKMFSHWERNGKKVSTNAAYSFRMPSEDVTLEAVFTDTAPTQVGTAIIESVTINTDKLAFVSVLNVPKNCKFVKGGLVATSDSNIGENVDASNAAYVKLTTKATANTKNVKYTWTKSAVGGSIWYVRGYLVYRDSRGTEYNVYSDCVKADKNGIFS